ncbi:hypothetical protein [Streptomyces sp. NRRL F-5630]|uniref:hypothetical protein n=1 Tax=unclassified Streptomyces TaxID=2593676 RepID=UPI000A7A1930|nr:hypothetical protein [Streptomyces sp. NRRL F-5630]
MISAEVFFPADEESSRHGSGASGSPSTPWPTGSRTAVGRAVGGRSPAPAHAPLTTPKTCGPTTRRPTTPEGNSRGLEPRQLADLAVYADPADPESTAAKATIAEATTIAVRRLVGQ